MSEYLTTSQAAELTGIPVERVRHWCKKQKRKGVDWVYKESGNWKISVEAFEALRASENAAQQSNATSPQTNVNTFDSKDEYSDRNLPVETVEAWSASENAAQQSNATQPPTNPSISDLVESTKLHPSVRIQRIRNHWTILIIPPLAGILLFIFAGISGLADFNPAWNQLRQVGKQFGFFREFKVRKEDEVLIVISKFYVTQGNRDTDIQNEIKRAIEQAADELKFSKLRVEVESTTLEVDARIDAENLGHLYDATIVIWGADTGVRVTVNYLNIKEPSFAAADVQITETERTQIANPSRYARFITDDLSSQLTFLALFAVGQSYSVEEEYANAITTIERAVSALNPETSLIEGLPKAYFRLGWLYQVPDNSHDLQKAVNYYTQSINLDPKNVGTYNNRGLAYGQQGKYELAITDFNQAITLDPKDATAYNNRGLVYSQQAEYELALTNFTQAITLDPEDAGAYNNRGNVYYYQGKHELAIADYTQAITLDPEYADAYSNRGNVYSNQGKHELAIADYTQAITLDPEYAGAYFNRGRTYKKQSKYELAVADYTQAITLDPEYATAYFNRGLIYSQQGKYELAIADYTQAITLDPEYAGAYYNRGKAHDEQGKYELAIADFNQAITLAFEYPTTYTSRGIVYYRQGKYELAIADYSQAITLDPEYATAYYNRGLVYSQQGKYELAVEDYKKVLKISGIPNYLREYIKQKIQALE